MTRTDDPPRIPRWLLAATLPTRDVFQTLIDDLDEEFAKRRNEVDTRSGAVRWYWSQAARSTFELLLYRLECSCCAEVMRAYLRACLLFLFAFGVAEVLVGSLVSRFDVPAAVRATALAGTLVAATALGSRGSCCGSTATQRLSAPVPTNVVVGGVSMGLGVLILSSCATTPPPVVWTSWFLSASLGASLGGIRWTAAGSETFRSI
ncbi:MAG: hypothetical protein MPN21_02390 [Thermoanaerobaculia bacterium]|nr:hypothetical protein [Thermoanaerobaculia bacterium]